ncbi:MAG: hypothetical protein GY788_14980 [bacterium]|nr:hypothetical protein [bacterium]
MALHALLIDSNDAIGWHTGHLSLLGGSRVLRAEKATDTLDWYDAKPVATTHSILTIDSSTKVVAWGSPDSFTWSFN